MTAICDFCLEPWQGHTETEAKSCELELRMAEERQTALGPDVHDTGAEGAWALPRRRNEASTGGPS